MSIDIEVRFLWYTDDGSFKKILIYRHYQKSSSVAYFLASSFEIQMNIYVFKEYFPISYEIDEISCNANKLYRFCCVLILKWIGNKNAKGAFRNCQPLFSKLYQREISN